jgi:hypothetical protein
MECCSESLALVDDDIAPVAKAVSSLLKVLVKWSSGCG